MFENDTVTESSATSVAATSSANEANTAAFLACSTGITTIAGSTFASVEGAVSLM